MEHNHGHDGDMISQYKCKHCGQSAQSMPSYTLGCPVDPNGNHSWWGGYSCSNTGCGLSFYINSPTTGCQGSNAVNNAHVWVADK